MRPDLVFTRLEQLEIMMNTHYRNHLDQERLALELAFEWIGQRVWQFTVYAATIAIVAQWYLAAN